MNRKAPLALIISILIILVLAGGSVAEPSEAPSPYGSVFEGGLPPASVTGSQTGVLWQSSGGMMMRTFSTVEALTVAYARYEPEPILAGQPATITIHAEGGDGDYRYMLALYYNKDSADEWFTSEGQPILPFQANPSFDITFKTPGYYMVHAYIEDSSGAQLVWSDAKFLVTTPADYSDPGKVSGKVAELAAQCKASASGAYARARWMHDWLTNNADYDQTYSISKPEGVLLLGTGVCDSYSRAYQMLLKAVGIPCLYVSHDAGNHAWNLVQLGGYWYHVDVTWDDPVGGSEGHRYFLVSDDFMREDGFTHSFWSDSAGEVPLCPYNWGEAPSGEPTPAPTAVVNPAPLDITRDGLTYTIMEGEAFLKSVDVPYLAALTVPASVEGYPVRGIMGKAFSPDNHTTFLSSLSLPEGLRSISPAALEYVSLPGTLTIPASVTGIGAEAFARMDQTTAFQVAGGGSFTSQGGVLFTADMTRVIQYPLAAQAASYTLPPTVTRIDDGAFAYCPDLRELYTSSDALDGGVYAFAGTDITIYGKDGTDLQANLARYTNPPPYIVTGGSVPKLPATVTITQDLSKDYDGSSVPEPDYEATGDGEVSVTFYRVTDAGRILLDVFPYEQGDYVVVVSQAEGRRYGAASDEHSFTIRVPAPVPVALKVEQITLDIIPGAGGAIIGAELDVSGGVPPYLLLLGEWIIVQDGTEYSYAIEPAMYYQNQGRFIFIPTDYAGATAAQIRFTVQDAAGAVVEGESLIAEITSTGEALPGDADNNGIVGILDLVAIIDYIVSGTPPASEANADATGEGDIDILDLVWIIDQIAGG